MYLKIQVKILYQGESYKLLELACSLSRFLHFLYTCSLYLLVFLFQAQLFSYGIELKPFGNIRARSVE